MLSYKSSGLCVAIGSTVLLVGGVLHSVGIAICSPLKKSMAPWSAFYLRYVNHTPLTFKIISCSSSAQYFIMFIWWKFSLLTIGKGEKSPRIIFFKEKKNQSILKGIH